MIKLAIAMPCKSVMHSTTVRSLLGLKVPAGTEWLMWQDGMVYEARNRMAMWAIDKELDYVLWLDSDMVYDPETFVKLMKDDKDIVTGIFYRRKPPYCTAHMRVLNEKEYAELTDYPDKLFTIEGMGTGIALTKVSALKKILEKEHELFLPMKGLSEDYSFSIRARKYYKIWCDPAVQAGHITEAVVTKEWWDDKD